MTPGRTKHSYHGNSDGNESDRDDSYPEDEDYETGYPQSNGGRRGGSRRETRAGGAESRLNLEEYLKRTDTAVIFPEPVDDPDIDDGKIIEEPFTLFPQPNDHKMI